jgi:hypothetical protein
VVVGRAVVVLMVVPLVVVTSNNKSPTFLDTTRITIENNARKNSYIFVYPQKVGTKFRRQVAVAQSV